VRQARKLIEQDGVDIIIGPLSGSEGIAMRDYAKTIPDKTIINGISGALETTWVDPAENFFRFNLDGAQWGAGLGTYVVEEKGWNRVATVAADYSFGYTNFLGFAVDFCRAGGEIVERFWVPLGSSDFGGVIASLPDDVDAIYLGVGGTDAINFLNQYNQAGAETNLIGGTIMADQTVLTSRGPRQGGADRHADLGPAGLRRSVRGLAELCRGLSGGFPEDERFPSPSLFGVGYYIATLAAIQAINEVDGDLSDGQAALHAALSNTPLDTPLGTVELNENRQASGSVFITEVVEDGEGGLKNEFKARVDNVTQTLGMTAEEFRAMGLPSRDNPDCAALAAPADRRSDIAWDRARMVAPGPPGQAHARAGGRARSFQLTASAWGASHVADLLPDPDSLCRARARRCAGLRRSPASPPGPLS
jgi:branched-chain amino acid transport system substrate-binding protein